MRLLRHNELEDKLFGNLMKEFASMRQEMLIEDFEYNTAMTKYKQENFFSNRIKNMNKNLANCPSYLKIVDVDFNKYISGRTLTQKHN